MIIRLYQRARRRVAYWHHLHRMIGKHVDGGYRLSQASYEVYQQEARKLAEARPSDPGPESAAWSWARDQGPDDVTRFDLIRVHPYLFERWR